MARVFMNPEKLEEKISNLEKFAQAAVTARNTVHGMYANDPIKSGESLGSLEMAIVTAANAIMSHAEELRKCKTTMLNLNSSGVAHHEFIPGLDIPGTIVESETEDSHELVVEVPDDSAGLETADKFEKWAQGTIDANDMMRGSLPGAPLRSGRSFDDVMESMKANKGDTTYSNSFIDRAGPRNLVKIGNHDDYNNNRQAPVIGEILATASQTWDEEKSKKNAALIAESLMPGRAEPNKYKNIVFNKIMGFHDVDSDGISDTKFGTNFLLSLGREVEAKDDESKSKWGRPLGSEDDLGSRDDPLWGVLDAMTGNEEAARGFLTPSGGNASDVNRVKELIARNEIGNNRWTNTWAALSARTAEAHGIDPYDETTKSPESHQAAAITTGVVNALGENFKSKGTSCQISGVARSRLSDALSKFPYAVDIAANRPANPDNYNPEVPDTKNATWAAGMSYQPKFTSEGLAGAIQVISENTDDLKRLTASLGDMRKVKTIHAAAHKDENSAQLEQTIKSNSTTNAFILGASRARIENDAAKVDANNQAIIDTLFAASNFLPGPGKEVPELWKKVADYGKTRSVDVLKSETEEMFTGNLEGAKLTSEELKKQDNKNSADDSILQLIALGVISKEALKNVTLTNSEEQSPIDDKGNFDFSKVDARVRGQLWEKFIHSNPTGQPDSVNRGLSSGVDNYDDAYNRGHG